MNFAAGEDRMKSGDTVVNLDIWRGENGSLYTVCTCLDGTAQNKKYACYIMADEIFSLLVLTDE